MVDNADLQAVSAPYLKPTLVKGTPATIRCVDVDGQTLALSGTVLRTASLEDEWFDDVRDPARTIESLRAARPRVDLFSFWQRLPDVVPRFAYHLEWEALAALPISTYEHWWQHQIKSRVRSQIRKAEKDGLVVRESTFDDAFVEGMTAIFNETPVRQGRPFWHYGKDAATIKQQFSRYLFRERMIGAYFEDRMVGFIMLADAGQFGLTGQIISSIHHRDKSPNNALIAKAVELCVERKFGHLVYLYWSEGSLSEFKRRCGFERVPVPRYYVPLTARGRMALRLGLHRGWKAALPPALRDSLKSLRNRWYAMRVPG
jgi:hypothetical protein